MFYFVASKYSFRIPSVSNSLDPDQARHFVGPDLGPKCLQRLSADMTLVKDYNIFLVESFFSF